MKNHIWLLLFLGTAALGAVLWFTSGKSEPVKPEAEPIVEAQPDIQALPAPSQETADALPKAPPPQAAMPTSPPASNYHPPTVTPNPLDQTTGFNPPPNYDAPAFEPPPPPAQKFPEDTYEPQPPPPYEPIPPDEEFVPPPPPPPPPMEDEF